MTSKSEFLKAVTIIVDTRENQCGHILSALDSLGVRYIRRKLDIGDFSFCLPTRDFSLSCVIERKANPDELYSNITEKAKVNRLEKEMEAANLLVNQFVLLIENVPSMDELKSFLVPTDVMNAAPQRKRRDIGSVCYSTIKEWQSANRYNFRVECVSDTSKTASKILEEFYYYYYNYKTLIAPRV